MVEEVEAELERKNDDYSEILEIGQALIDAAADEQKAIAKGLTQVQTVTDQLRQTISDHKDSIQRIEEYKNFTQESRVIESHISSCRRLLFDQAIEQLSEDELNDMSKRQLLLAAMIESYEDRVEKFIQVASQLSPECHVRYEDCVHKKDEIAQNWQNLNEEFSKCQAKLQDNRTFLDLATTIEEMEKFIGEKEKLAGDMSYRDPIHLRAKYKKHEALDGEVKAHGSEMKLIKLKVEKLAEEDHPQKEVIIAKYDGLAKSWERLLSAIQSKYDFIKESLIDVDVSNGIDNITSKATLLAKELTTPLDIHDVKHCNQEIAKHKANYAVFKQMEDKYKTLEADATDAGQDKVELKETLEKCNADLKALRPLFDDHMTTLHESLKFHEMMSELNTELQWIKEKEKLILMGDVGKGLMQVRSQTKRHRSLEEEVSNHLPVIYELIGNFKKSNSKSKYSD